jgi:hypothetical protein
LSKFLARYDIAPQQVDKAKPKLKTGVLETGLLVTGQDTKS